MYIPGTEGAKARESEDSESDSEGDEEERGYADNVDQPGTHFDTKGRQTVRNLRIREVCVCVGGGSGTGCNYTRSR